MSQQTQSRTEIEAAIIAKAQADPAFRQALLSNARTAIERELGFPLPAGVDFKVLEETPTNHYLVLPCEPGFELSEAELESVSGGVQKHKMQSASKHAEAVRSLL